MKQGYKISMKLFTFIMAFILVFVSMPVAAFAEAIKREQDDTIATEESLDSLAEGDSVANDIIVLTENEELRQENVKHFKLSDGTTKAVVYPQAVHYKDSNGKWIDIDNALTLNGSEYSSSNKTQIKFGNKSGSSGLVSIKDGEYKIDFTPLNTNKVAVIIENPQENNSRKFEDVSKLNNLVSKAIYKNIYDGIDIEYILVGNNIKENIIVKEKQDSYTFSFELKLNKLSAELADNVIILSDYDTKEKVYEIPAPYMFDNSNEFSENVEYSLTQNSKWKYTFTVTADAEWINADERVFPVTVDPAVFVDSSDIFDFSSNASYTATTLSVGGTVYTEVETLTLPSMPKNSYVVSVQLYMYCVTAGNNYIAAFASADATDTPIDFCYIEKTGEYCWEISSLYKQWTSNGNSFDSVFLRSISGSGTSVFHSYEYGSGSPLLTFTYRDMKGIESYWSYTSQDVGIAGTGSINLATSNLVFAIPTLTSTDSLFGFTPTLIYNSALAGLDYTNANAQVAYRGAYAAKGFKFNGQETVMRCYYNGINGVNAFYYVWADADGTEHYFHEKEGNSVYEDEDGLGCKLEIVSDTELKITDANFNTRTFTHLTGSTLSNVTKAWYLTSFTDKNGNKLSFTFTSGKNPIAVNVTPNGGSSIEMLTIGYSTDHRMNLIWNKTSGKACLIRHSDTPTGALNATGGAYLREMLILQCDSTVTAEMLQAFVGDFDNVAGGITVEAVAIYGYDNSGRLISVTDTLIDYCIEYEYYSSNNIGCVFEFGGNEDGNYLPISYYDGYTELTSIGADEAWGVSSGTCDDIVTTYVFDECGRATTVYSTNYNGEKIYSITAGQYTSGNEKTANRLLSSAESNQISTNYFVNGALEASESDASSWITDGDVRFYASPYLVGWDNADITMYTAPNGTASVVQTAVLDKGTYTFSLKLDSAHAEGMTVYLKASSATYSYQKEVSLNEISASGGDGFASFTFTVRENTPTAYTVGVYAYGGESIADNASVIIDNLMLSKTTGMAEFNYVNSSTSTVSSDIGKWILQPYATVEETNTAFGEAVKITGSVSEERQVSQKLYYISQSEVDRVFETGGTANITTKDIAFTVAGVGMASSGMKNEESKFEIELKISWYKYIAGAMSAQEPAIATAVFLCDKTGWQYASQSCVVPAGSIVTSIDLTCKYSHNLGEAYFGDISLIMDDESVVNNVYDDEDGTVVYSQVGGVNRTYYEYDDNKNIIDAIGRKARASYVYDDRNNLIEVLEYKYSPILFGENDNIETLEAYLETRQILASRTTYSYNSYGLLTSLVKYDAENAQSMQTTYVYDTVGTSKFFGALKEEINSFDQRTQYFYDNKTGNLIAVIAPDSTGYYYTYDEMGKLVMVQPAICAPQPQPVEYTSEVEYVYNELCQLESIVANGMTYSFLYDNFGNRQGVTIGATTILDATYSNTHGNLESVTCVDGTTVYYTYDELLRVKKIRYVASNGDTAIYEYEYDSNGNLSKVLNKASNTYTAYKYDGSGRLVKMIEYDNGKMKNNFGISYHYDTEKRISSQFYYRDYLYNSGQDFLYVKNYYKYSDNGDGTLRKMDISVGEGSEYRINYVYDGLYRVDEKTISIEDTENSISYEYITSDNKTSYVVSQYRSEVLYDGNVIAENVFNYTYDVCLQNITEIKDKNGNWLYRYTYDSLDRLIREDNSVTNRTYTYSYDNNGNILEEGVYYYTTGAVNSSNDLYTNAYTYNNSNWKDQLTAYCGSQITYDSMGNPLNYYNGLRFTWSNINKLTQVKGWGRTVTYTYNDSGIRTSKTIDDVTHTYHLDGTRILSEEYGNTLILYIYDETGSIIGMAYRENSYAKGVFDYYLFTKNLQGDILSIYDTNGTRVASYKYNAWGECSITNYTTAAIGNINPFRYRGYYYDIETDLYYLNARYYDPYTKRFINADEIGYLGANRDLNAFNLYAYCANNPVNCIDPNGNCLLLIYVIISSRNQKKNKMVEEDHTTQNTIIDNQDELVAYRYGFWSAAYNGCEALAIHNARVMLGKDSNLADSITACQLAGGMWLFGTFGTKPRSVGSTLEFYGMEYSEVTIDELTTPGVYIISYWNSDSIFGGIHTVAFKYDGETYTSYNRGKKTSYEDPKIYANRYICGYYLGTE